MAPRRDERAGEAVQAARHQFKGQQPPWVFARQSDAVGQAVAESQTPVVDRISGQQHGGVARGLGRRQTGLHQGAADAGAGEFRGHGQGTQDQDAFEAAGAVLPHCCRPETHTPGKGALDERHASELG
ncbi:MAG: hypothetical protein QF797_13005 [Alphaproteobacteria bacterium]|jgi:hypothetical protein|nr:hypothetical protein [Alphaproteobacteria bacterium]